MTNRLHVSIIAAFLLWSSIASARCLHPVYVGLRHHMIMRFEGESGENVSQEHGSIRIGKASYRFSTTHSNGHGDEYIIVSVPSLKNALPDQQHEASSIVMRKNVDFTDSHKHESDYLITPELPLKFYYLSYDRPSIDDTWKLIGCN